LSAKYDICVVGGGGRAGLGLSLAFATRGVRVRIYDTNTNVVEKIRRGEMPFLERDGETCLRKALAEGNLDISAAPDSMRGVPTVIVIIGTPIDEFHNPDLKGFIRCFDDMRPSLTNDQLLILRSTVYPGVTDWLRDYLDRAGLNPLIAFCPERIVEGHALRELATLPQIVSGVTPEAEQKAADLFLRIAPTVVRMHPMEAEFGKLFANVYRYIQFAAANQFFMMATAAGLDFYKILEGLKRDYPRLSDLPGAGFAAGPCLFKDTMQLSSFSDNKFGLGYSAMLVNEGLPSFVVDQMAKKHHLPSLKVGILGMAFKANSDNIRSSLSYKLKKLLQLRAKEVLTADPFVKDDPELVPIETLLTNSDLIVIGTGHVQFRSLDMHGKPVVDIWNFFGKGCTI
jgi:UDP-N-acetyl-D-mannosaminuronic acid dehydrogenase